MQALRYLMRIAVLLCAVLMPATGNSHALEPGYLDIREQQDGVILASWKVPDVAGSAMEITAVLPQGCSDRRPPPLVNVGAAYIGQWNTVCEGGLAGKDIWIEGLEKTSTDVLVRYEQIDGTTRFLRITADAPTQTLDVDPGFWSVVKTYFLLGIDHILLGFDHILFVLALILLVHGNWKLVKTITAFTLAHSITLSLASLGYVHVPVPPVEAIIALSIVFIAVELARRDPNAPGLAERKPWLVAFTFGLLHGLGFASALSETGLPQGDIPAALVTFNLGVEAGQLLFVGAILVLRVVLNWVARRLSLPKASGANFMTGVIYGIGGISAYWLIERVVGFVA
ncbi:MAG: HupE/UreJ family protein [Marinosulfonomonas sp.]